MFFHPRAKEAAMAPQNSVQHRMVEAGRIRLHVAEQGEGPAVVLCHGWPETWYSWRHQLKALAAAGFRALAPDMRGYGRSDRPEPVEAYTQLHIVGAMVAFKAGGMETIYMMYFQEPGVAEREFERDVKRTLASVYYSASGSLPPDQRWRPFVPPGKGLLDTGFEPSLPLPWLSEA